MEFVTDEGAIFLESSQHSALFLKELIDSFVIFNRTKESASRTHPVKIDVKECIESVVKLI